MNHIFSDSWSSLSYEYDETDTETSESSIGYEYIDIEYSPVEKVLVEECYCFDNEKFADRFVEATITEAVDAVEKQRRVGNVEVALEVIEEIVSKVVEFESEPVFEFFGEDVSPYYPSAPAPISYYQEGFTGWPKISEFNIKLGLEKLEDYVDTWERSEEWSFCVEFLGFESEEISNYFVYEVQWSMPAASYPIPQASASVFFSLEVSKIIPHTHDRPVEVSYVFEGTRLIHKPGKHRYFQEKWLRDIIESKQMLFKKLTF